jgi:hypothetical protein
VGRDFLCPKENNMSTAPTTLIPGDIATVPVKSKWGSKTNITAILLGFFGLLVASGKLPPELATPGSVGGIVTAGSVLVALFRTYAKAILA